MAHVYRAIWRNDNFDVVASAVACFEAWLRLRNTPIPIQFEDLSHRDSRTITATAIATPSESGIQIVLREALPDGRSHWSTSVTAMHRGGAGCFCVDVYAQVDNIWQRSIAAPRVVRELLLSGGRPYLGEDVLEVQPHEVDDDKSLGRLVASILSPRREVPLVVIGVPDDQTPNRSRLMQIATRTSDMLAGVAQVALVESRQLTSLNSLLPNSLAVDQHAARLFIPGVHAETESERYSTAFDVRSSTEDPAVLGALVAKRIAVTTSWPAVEELFLDLRESLNLRRRKIVSEKSTETIVGTTTESIPDPVSGELQPLLEKIDSLQDELIDVTELANEWYEQAQWYQDQLVHLLMEHDDAQDFVGETMASIIEEVRKLSLHISIPATAPREIEALDTNMAALVWARDLAKLFTSMERYATARLAGSFKGSYLQWCSEMADYPDTKVSMQESEPTKNNPRLRKTRTFPVSLELDPSGRKVMYAHAKIQAKGGILIPRVFFHDDVVGKTKKIHIGFIGPHHLVPTSTF